MAAGALCNVQSAPAGQLAGVPANFQTSVLLHTCRSSAEGPSSCCVQASPTASTAASAASLHASRLAISAVYSALRSQRGTWGCPWAGAAAAA